MSLVTKIAPDFSAKAVMGNNSFETIKLSDYRNKYVVLFFYPMDFTFVCPTELIAFDKKLGEFEKLNTQVLAVSVDSEYSHFAWKEMPRNEGGIGKVNYPIVSDITKQISKDYGVLINDSVALRGLFLIDKDGIVQHELVNNLPLGRNVDEALRMVQALQFVEEHGEVCPANWQNGKSGMVPSVTGVAQFLSQGDY